MTFISYKPNINTYDTTHNKKFYFFNQLPVKSSPFPNQYNFIKNKWRVQIVSVVFYW